MWTFFDRILRNSTCLLCDATAQGEWAVCAGCINDLPRIPFPCKRCGVALSNPGAVCGSCLNHPPPVDTCVALFDYAAPVDRMLQQLKFHRQLAYAQLFGGLLLESVTQSTDELPDAILPVPLHPQRLRKRGYNQALEIAKPLARELGLPLLRTECIRTLATHAQADLKRDERQKNIRGAFAVTAPLPFKRVAIVDDVMTTGNTVYELAKTVKRAGVEFVDVWACARASLD